MDNGIDEVVVYRLAVYVVNEGLVYFYKVYREL